MAELLKKMRKYQTKMIRLCDWPFKTSDNCLFHGEKFWTRTRSKYTDLGEFETIWLYKTIRL